MYKYYSCLGLSLIKHNTEEKDIHNEMVNNIPHLIKNCVHGNFIQDGFVMYNDKVLIRKPEVITPITDYMIPVDFC